MTPYPSTGRAPIKKRLLPSPWGRPVTAPRGTPRTDPLTIYQSVGRKPDPNCRAFSCGPHSRWASVSCAGFHSGGKLLGRRCWRSSLHPPLAMIMTQHDGADEQGEADPQAVQGEERQDRPQEHAFEQVVERAEQQAPQAMPVSQDGFRLAVEGPCRAYGHC